MCSRIGKYLPSHRGLPTRLAWGATAPPFLMPIYLYAISACLSTPHRRGGWRISKRLSEGASVPERGALRQKHALSRSGVTTLPDLTTARRPDSR